jgi:hypothetical protein
MSLGTSCGRRQVNAPKIVRYIEKNAWQWAGRARLA